jgi:hypothetical protein
MAEKSGSAAGSADIAVAESANSASIAAIRLKPRPDRPDLLSKH